MKRSPLKRGNKRLRSRRIGRHPLAQQYANENRNCELCPLLEGDAWEEFRSWDWRPCIASAIHHVFTPSRWDSPANYVHVCATSHEFVEKYARVGRLFCTIAKLKNGTFDREVVREKWRRDPIDDLHLGFDLGEFRGLEDAWLFVSERF